MPTDLRDVSVLVRVVELGSFTKAARELGVPTSTVTRAVARLEASLDVRLLQRTTRSLTPTSEGRAFCEDVAPALATIQRAARGLASAEKTARGTLRVAAHSEIGTWLLARSIARFSREHPLVRLELEFTSRRVNLVKEGFDVAIVLGPLHDSSLVTTKLADLHAAIFASVGYVEKSGLPRTLGELDQHPCVLYRARGGVAEWTFDGPAGRVKQLVQGRITSDDYGAVRAIVLDGAGIARLPMMMVHSDVREGRLVRVLPEYASTTRSLHFIHESHRNVPPKIRLFRAVLMDDLARGELDRRAHTRS